MRVVSTHRLILLLAIAPPSRQMTLPQYLPRTVSGIKWIRGGYVTLGILEKTVLNCTTLYRAVNVFLKCEVIGWKNGGWYLLPLLYGFLLLKIIPPMTIGFHHFSFLLDAFLYSEPSSPKKFSSFWVFLNYLLYQQIMHSRYGRYRLTKMCLTKRKCRTLLHLKQLVRRIVPRINWSTVSCLVRPPFAVSSNLCIYFSKKKSEMYTPHQLWN